MSISSWSFAALERYYRDFADGPAYTSHAAQDGFDSNEDLEEFLAKAFAGRGQQRTFRARGQDVSGVLPVAFRDAAKVPPTPSACRKARPCR